MGSGLQCPFRRMGPSDWYNVRLVSHRSDNICAFARQKSRSQSAEVDPDEVHFRPSNTTDTVNRLDD